MTTIKEIDENIEELSEQIKFLKKKRLYVQLEEKSWIGKYLHIEDFGYIYVTSVSVRNGDVFLQGRTFNYSFSDDIDDYYFTFDLLGQITLSSDLYKVYLESGRIKEISKEHFFETLTKVTENFSQKSIERLKETI